MNENCIFCKVISGEIPSKKLWETEDLICILDAFPVSKGHSLILTKKHFKTISDCPDDILEQILPKIKETTELLKNKLFVNNFNILQNNGKLAGQEVEHLHFHIIPIYEDDDAKVICGTSTKNKISLDDVFKEIK